MIASFLLKGSIGINIALGIMIGYLTYGKMSLQISLAKIEAENIGLVNTVEAISSAKDKQDQTIKLLMDSSTDAKNEIRNLTEANQKSQSKTREAKNEINLFRISEQERALSKPFERGNASGSRIRAHLLRFSETRPKTNNGEG